MVAALDRLADLIALGGQDLDVSMVPQRRVIGLATYGLSSKAPLLAGTPRDSLNVIDVVQLQRGGKVPEAIITDTGSYSDIVFGLLHLIGIKYRPQLANLPDQRLWRFDDKLSLTLERVAGTHSWSAGKGLGGTTLGLIVSGSP